MEKHNLFNPKTMIKADDLKLGNYVKVANEYACITCISQEGISCNSDTAAYVFEEFDDIDPIPLSPAILEKCGFEQMEAPRIYGLARYRYYVDCGWFYVLSDSDDEVLLNDEIEYLHQLQNLYYALTTTDLPVNLKIEKKI